MSFNAIRENKILAKISEFTVVLAFIMDPMKGLYNQFEFVKENTKPYSLF